MDLTKYKKSTRPRLVTYTLYLPLEVVEELRALSDEINARRFVADDVATHTVPKLRKALQAHKKESA
jgi:hypothetical protein